MSDDWFPSKGQPVWDSNDYSRDFTWLGFDRGMSVDETAKLAEKQRTAMEVDELAMEIFPVLVSVYSEPEAEDTLKIQRKISELHGNRLEDFISARAFTMARAFIRERDRIYTEITGEK